MIKKLKVSKIDYNELLRYLDGFSNEMRGHELVIDIALYCYTLKGDFEQALRTLIVKQNKQVFELLFAVDFEFNLGEYLVRLL